MKKIIEILILAMLCVNPAHAMGDKPSPNPNPTCFVSDKLRVQVGEEAFTFLRKDIMTLEGSQVPAHQSSKGRYTHAQALCQKPTDPAVQVEKIIIDMLQQDCYTKNNGRCVQSKVQVELTEDVNPSHTDTKIQNYKDRFKKKCRDTSKLDPKEYLPYGDICDYIFYYNKIPVFIIFHTGSHPASELEKTIGLVTQQLEHSEIKK